MDLDDDGAKECYVLSERGSHWLEASFGSHSIRISHRSFGIEVSLFLSKHVMVDFDGS